MIILRNKQFSIKDRINYIKNDINIPFKTGAGMILGGLGGLVASGNLKYTGATALGGGLIGGVKGIYDSNKNYNESLRWSNKSKENAENAKNLNPTQENLKNNPPKEYIKLKELVSSNQYKKEASKVEDIYSEYDINYPDITVYDIDGNTEIDDKGDVVLISLGSCFFDYIEYNINTKTWKGNHKNIPNLKNYIIDTLKNLESDRVIGDLNSDEISRIKKFTGFLIQQIRLNL